MAEEIEVLEDKPSTSEHAAGAEWKWKSELKSFIDYHGVDIADDAARYIIELKENMLKKQEDEKFKEQNAPELLKCPISRELMSDPVVLASGVTYDRPYIQRWLDAGNWTCPLTKKLLSDGIFIPNHLVREMITQWCTKHKVSLKPYISDEERSRLVSLLGKVSSSDLSQWKEAAKEIRLLTKYNPSVRGFFTESKHLISQLLKPLSECSLDTHPDLQEDLITIIFNICILGDNRQLVADNPLVVPLLIKYLTSGTIVTRSNAAAALFCLSDAESGSNRLLIGDSGAVKPLIELLKEQDHESAMKDAVKALVNLCFASDNQGRAVRGGVVSVIWEFIENEDTENVFVRDRMLAILSSLTDSKKAAREMTRLPLFIHDLLRIIRDTSCKYTKQNCAVIVYAICLEDGNKWKEVWIDEDVHHTLLKLNLSGTSQAKRATSGILKMLKERYYSSE